MVGNERKVLSWASKKNEKLRRQVLSEVNEEEKGIGTCLKQRNVVQKVSLEIKEI